jgi:hypothetical protein
VAPSELRGGAASRRRALQSMKMWDGVVDCYVAAGRKTQAEQLVLTLLEKPSEQKDLPRLHCILGDINNGAFKAAILGGAVGV